MSGIGILTMAMSSAGLSATASPPSLNTASTGAPYTTPATTAIPAGGSGSYSYAWAVSDPPALGTFTIDSPSSPTTTVTVDDFLSGDIMLGAIECTVTDTVSLATAAVEVSVRHRDQGTPP